MTDSETLGASLFHRAIRAAAVLVLGGAVAACGLMTPGKPPPPCPPILVLKDAATLTKLRPGSGRDITDVLYSGQITDFRAECKFEKDLSEVEIRLNIAFVLTRGAANTDRKVRFEYFVAMPRFHPLPQGKKVFGKSGEFTGNRARLGAVEEVTLTIPLQKGSKLDEYRILIGFQLTPQEIEFNRSRNRF